jgi:hydroxymethylbilane synthase
VLRGDADIAVHSAKDLPSAPTEGLRIGAFCARRDARDVLIGAALAELVAGATVATGSVRRRAQLGSVRPDLHFVELRGNIHTRLGKIPADGAIVMAAAALEVLGLTERIDDYLPLATFVPSPGQGAVAVECRPDDPETLARLVAVDHAETRRAVEVERAFLAELGSGCSLPVGAHVAGARLTAFLGGADHTRSIRKSIDLPDEVDAARADAARLARAMHARLS